MFPNVKQIESAAALAHYLSSIRELNTRIAQATSHFGEDKCIEFRKRYDDVCFAEYNTTKTET
jgi:hypothetical protein